MGDSMTVFMPDEIPETPTILPWTVQENPLGDIDVPIFIADQRIPDVGTLPIRLTQTTTRCRFC